MTNELNINGDNQDDIFDLFCTAVDDASKRDEITWVTVADGERIAVIGPPRAGEEYEGRFQARAENLAQAWAESMTGEKLPRLRRPILTWHETRNSSFYGFAGERDMVPGQELFAIHWRTRQVDPDWALTSMLPGLAGKRWKDDSRVALERQAEDVLADWIAKITRGAGR